MSENIYPIGIQDFEKLRKGGYFYVDKTALVYKYSHYFPIIQPFLVKLLFPSHHLIYIAVLRMPAFQSHPQQHRTELHGIAATHQGGMRLLQLVEDIGSSQVKTLLCRNGARNKLQTASSARLTR